MAEARTWSEIRLLFESFRLPPLARQAVENHLLVSRRQRYEARKLAQAAAVPRPVQLRDPEPQMLRQRENESYRSTGTQNGDRSYRSVWLQMRN